MKSLHRFFISIFIMIVLILCLFPYFKSKDYDYYIVPHNNQHSIANDGTFVVFHKIPIDEIEIYDVIQVLNTDNKIARILEINKEKETFTIVYDDFDKNKVIIPISEYNGSLVFHLNEIGNLYEDYLYKYKNYFIIIPFVFLTIGFIFLMLYIKTLDKETFDFEFQEIIKVKEENKFSGDSITEKISLDLQIVNYNTSIVAHKPSFILKTGFLSKK